ncbi:nucleoside hydrolase [Roseibium sp. SCP14]|uniref:nucleoside hydrolase n=1 Tax=Roseibium sp. SCP14 TaxID=3141375 RepID=UPI0033372866
MRKKVILDVDTGADDAIAIMLAATCREMDLVACTTVYGNRHVDQTTTNTLAVLDHIGRQDVPVFKGADRPLVKTNNMDYASDNDGAPSSNLPVKWSHRQEDRQPAADFLVETFRTAKEPISLVALAPLTNIATCLAMEPKFTELVPDIVIMGGAHNGGNMTPAAEFNIWHDPDAAEAVFSAGFKTITLVTLDATHQALVARADCDRLASSKTAASQATAAIIRQLINAYDRSEEQISTGTAPVHDALAVASLLRPNLLRKCQGAVNVETLASPNIGQTTIDLKCKGAAARTVEIALNADGPEFVRYLTVALTGC